ncbi:transport and Golgi organization protein 6 homolog isoform X1 [Neodiprion fabricii]|uniref:transport and Golgi organization protein 6 homolog isoform X1 n=3 Tax=Neodiprion fabricii TaxID=2872261 RepID=UPI001ED8D0A8|nr:transport and Golgi organization protein 6 homolog isoform X1 [Neodiprion fabricii]
MAAIPTFLYIYYTFTPPKNRAMDCFEGLSILTSNEKRSSDVDFDAMLSHILQGVYHLVPDEVECDIKKTINDKNKPREAFLQAILYFLNEIRNTKYLDGDTSLGVKQLNSLKRGIEIAISMMIPCLLPGVGVGIQYMCPRAAQLPAEQLTDFQKYERLSNVVKTILNCFDESTMQPTILPQIGSLLAALIQLSTVPLTKPCNESENSSGNTFRMTAVIYNQLKREQEQFRVSLLSLIDKLPQSTVVKELMIILGVRRAPRWLRRETQRLLISRIMKPNGIVALVLSMCDDGLDSGAHWAKLDVIAKLIATPQGTDPDIYYNSICSQLLNLLDSKGKDSLIVTSLCMNALYERNPTVFTKQILNPIMEPLLITVGKSETMEVLRTEIEVTKCIENLSKCFTSNGAEFKCLPSKLLCVIAVPLFRLYTKAYRTVYLHRKNLEQLMLLLLREESMQADLFAILLVQHRSNHVEHDFGNNLTFRFGPHSEFEVTNQVEYISCDEFGDCLLHLVQNDKILSYNLFCYLLESLSRLNENCHCKNKDIAHDMEVKLVYAKLLSILADTHPIQEAYIRNPQHILLFVISLVEDKSANDKENGNEIGIEFDVLYISLMLVKFILENKRKSIDWKPFDKLATALGKLKSCRTSTELSTLAKQVTNLIKTKGALARPRYQDLSESNEKVTEFDKAIHDLADPLLPVRAHGLMLLTKLVERSDHDVIAQKDIVLCLFQENLKHEDSFIYLSAINGLAALASAYPEKVIEVLVHEFIDITSASKESTISPDTRAKIGEILVKVTRSLGELAPTYKNILINGFLCGTRDVDPLVRTSSLSCLGELCKVLGYRLGNIIVEVIFCIGSIIKTDKIAECRRAGVMVTTLLLQGLGKAALISLGNNLVPLYRALLSLQHDEDSVLRLHAQLALNEFDDIVRDFLFSKPKLEKSIFVLEPTL